MFCCTITWGRLTAHFARGVSAGAAPEPFRTRLRLQRANLARKFARKRPLRKFLRQTVAPLEWRCNRGKKFQPAWSRRAWTRTSRLKDFLSLANSLRISSKACATTSFAALPEKRSEEHTSELQSQSNIVCRLL